MEPLPTNKQRFITEYDYATSGKWSFNTGWKRTQPNGDTTPLIATAESTNGSIIIDIPRMTFDVNQAEELISMICTCTNHADEYHQKEETNHEG